MTAARQQRKPEFLSLLRRAAFGLVLALGLPSMPPSQAATTERIVVDPHRGLAIDGFDPVAYFTDAKPVLGRGDFEYQYAGVVWRFRNEGNRAAFEENPEIYAPALGGHDPVAAARGVAAPGHPEIWMIHGDRLYLFYSPQARRAFAADPEQTAAAAGYKWQAVSKTLSP